MIARNEASVRALLSLECSIKWLLMAINVRTKRASVNMEASARGFFIQEEAQIIFGDEKNAVHAREPEVRRRSMTKAAIAPRATPMSVSLATTSSGAMWFAPGFCSERAVSINQ